MSFFGRKYEKWLNKDRPRDPRQCCGASASGDSLYRGNKASVSGLDPEQFTADSGRRAGAAGSTGVAWLVFIYYQYIRYLYVTWRPAAIRT